MKIAIIGAGGVGGYFGGVLARAGHDVRVLARGANLAALRERGLEVRTPDEHYTVAVQASDNVSELGPVDCAIVAVKTYSLDEVAPAVRALAEGGAIVLPLLNGVDAAERFIASGVPQPQVLGGLTAISVVRTAPGVFERKSPFARVVVGEMRGGNSERAQRIAADFSSAGVDAKASDDIAADLWRKFAFIASVAAACGLARSPIGPIRSSELGRSVIERAIGEVVAVARARGV